MATPVLFGYINKDGKVTKDPSPRGDTTPVSTSGGSQFVTRVVKGDLVKFQNGPDTQYLVQNARGHWASAKADLKRIPDGMIIRDVECWRLVILEYYSPHRKQSDLFGA